MLRKSLTISTLVTVAILGSCKKDKNLATPSPTPPVVVPPVSSTASRADLTRDSIFLYAKQVYYWNDALPTYDVFNPRKYTTLGTDLANFQKELFDISQIKINPATGKPFEYYTPAPTFSKYSRIDVKSAGTVIISAPNTMNSVDQQGNGDDYGLEYGGAYTSAAQTNYAMYVLYVNPSSPGARAGIRRGDLITAVNGTTIGGNPSAYSTDLTALDNAFNAATATVNYYHEGQAKTVALTKAKYNASPIFKDSVYTSGATKVGYFCYSSFTSETNSGAALRNLFSKFATQGITDLVVDLRYNGGGFESSAVLMSNLIAPSSVTGTTMFTEFFNSTMQAGNATLLAKQPLLDQQGKQRFSNGRALFQSDINFTPEFNTEKFAKEGTLGSLRKVVFIGTGNTASASELVLNNLKPHMNVKLVGTKTYGKPIGFFPITIDKYDVYYAMIGLKNSAGQGDYFDGFTPDFETRDVLGLDWGDTRDPSLNAALAYIITNNYSSAFTVSKTGTAGFKSIDEHLRDTKRNNFKGLVIDKFRVK